MWLTMFQLDPGPTTSSFTIACFDVKNQQMQTEILETMDRHVQAGSSTHQQGGLKIYFTLLHLQMSVLTCGNSKGY